MAAEEAISTMYMLKSIGVQVLGRVCILCDNKGVVDNSTISGSALKKKHLSIAYHKVRECVALGICDVYHIKGKDNPADVLTKSLVSSVFRKHISKFMYGQGLPNFE